MTRLYSASARARAHARNRKTRPVAELLETRLCMSTASPALGGVDALAMGDVNGDQVADVAVAWHRGGHEYVTVYSGWGKQAASGTTSTGFDSLPLVQLVDPLGVGSGPLDVALGDFSGTGVSDLAVATTSASKGSTPRIGVWSFSLVNSSPINSPVTSTALPQPDLSSFSKVTGFHIAAADLLNQGEDQLLIAAGGRGQNSIVEESFDPQTSTWSMAGRVGDVPVSMKRGVSLSAGDITGDGVPDLVAGSEDNGRVSIYDGALQRWTWTSSPLGKKPGTVRVAVVTGVDTPGAYVATGFTKSGGAKVAVVPYQGTANHNVKLATSPGGGALVPLGGGYVYQWSTVQNASSSFPTSNGPTTPTILFGATSGDSLLVQGFKTQSAPSTNTLDYHVEPLWNPSKTGFTPLQPQSDPAATGQQGQQSAANQIPINLIVYPKIVYHSPYAITLLPVAGLTNFNQGLLPYSSVSTTPAADGLWGPDKVPNVPPTVPSTLSTSDAATWLRERVISAYESFIGVDYQHHHDPSWQPTQGTPWNITSTVAYQSQGIDCTNFTAYAYADALGITLNSDTGTQAAITPTNTQGTVIPSSIAPYLQLQTITSWSSYTDLINQLEPGDILFINGNPNNTNQATHAITWLGQYGIDPKTGDTLPLVIDSTGITPPHVDLSNHVVPEGVHIRPFGAPGTVNDWYFNHVNHVLRIIAN